LPYHQGAIRIIVAIQRKIQAVFSGGLRVDYVLPSADMQVVGSGVFWPVPDDPLYRLVEDSTDNPSSDHHLVWVDVALP